MRDFTRAFTVFLVILNLLFVRNLKSQTPDQGKKIYKIFPGYDHPVLRIADSLYAIDAFDNALARYQKALAYFIREKNWKGIAYTNYMIADIFNNRYYDPKKATPYIQRSYDQLKYHLNEDTLLKADFYLINGTVLTKTKSDSALVLMKMALKAYNSELEKGNRMAGEVYFCMGQVLNHVKWNYDSALVCLKLSESICQRYYPISDIRNNRAFYYIASTYHQMYDVKNALINADQCISLLMDDSVRNRGYIATFRGMMGNLYSDIRNDSLALYYYNLSIPVYEEFTGQIPELCKMYLSVCQNYLRNVKLTDCRDYLEKAIKVYKAYGMDDPDVQSNIDYIRGWYYTLTGHFISAREYLDNSLTLVEDNYRENFLRISDIYLLKSRMFNKERSYDSALYYSQEALMAIDSTFKDTDYSANPGINFRKDRVRLYDILSNKAEIFTNQYHKSHNIEYLEEALKIYLLLDELGDQMRNSGIPEDSQLILTELFQKGNESGVESAMQLYIRTGEKKYLDYILKFMEKSKYMQLFKAAHIAQRTNRLKIPESYIHLYDSLNTEMSRLDQTIESENRKDLPDFRKLTDLNSRRLLVNEKRQEFVSEMSQKYPNYFYVNFDSLTISVKDISDYVSENHQLFVEFYMGEKNAYVFALSEDTITVHNNIALDNSFADNLYDYITTVSIPSIPDSVMSDFSKFCNSSFDLYNKLLKPVLDEHGFAGSGSILIVPDGILSRIPFEALISRYPEKINANYSSLHYLIRDHLVEYVYSANLLLKNTPETRPAENDMLAFSYSSIQSVAQKNQRGQNSNELLGTALEMKAIKKVMGNGNLYFEDKNATEHNFKVHAHDYRIIHLGIHGQADLSNPLNSKLLFKKGNDSVDDGILYVYELYNLDLSRTQLAVLSACETGLGKEFHGEGVFSVARGFVYAGCPTVIMSLWRVNDIQSARIMGEFYRQLRKGNKTAEALRTSKLRFLETSEGLRAHPSNWAAFVMLGEDRSYFNKLNYIEITLGIIVFLFILLFIVFRNKKMKST